jgi:hypothetical protein
MATITITDELDVAAKYNTLVRQSLDGDSAYIRAKETINDLVSDGAIADSQKAEIISNIIGSISSTITTASMSTAMQWASAEKEIALKKLELGKQLDILDKDILLKDAQVTQALNATRLAKIESKRIYGTAVFDTDDNVVSLTDTGKVFNDMVLTTAQIAKTAEEVTLVTQKISESHAAVHKIVADTYVNYGAYSYTGLTAAGISTVTANHNITLHKTLSETQKDIAIEQAKGYVYNAWANALTGSASMLGTAISSGYDEFGVGGTGHELLLTVLDVAKGLQAATTTTDDAVPYVATP